MSTHPPQSASASGTTAAPQPVAMSLSDTKLDATRPNVSQIIEQSPFGNAVIDFDGVYVEVNAAYCATYGYTRDEMIGRSFRMVFPAAEGDRVLALHQHYLAVGGDLKGEWSVLRRDGVRIDVISESVRVQGDDGRTRRLVYIVDITERKRIEVALQLSQFFLLSVLDGLTAHVCVLDAAGVVVMVNQPWRDFANANGGQMDRVHEGASYLRVCETAVAASPTANQGAMDFLVQLRDVLAGRRSSFQIEYPCHSPTEERWFLARVSRVDGSVPPRVVVAHDNVTAIKQVQQALRDREAALLDLAASIPGAMFRLQHRPDDSWHFAYLSPGIEALFGVSAAQGCADIHTLLERVVPEDRAGLGAVALSVMAHQGVWEHEFRIDAGSGSVKWIHAKAQPKNDEHGEHGARAWTGVLTDVSERKGIEAALHSREATYRTLFETVPQGIVYHDRNGVITLANPAAQRILGLSLDQMRGLHAIDPRWGVVREDGSDLPDDELPAMRVLKTGLPATDVAMGVNVPHRDRVWILVNATPLFKDGRLDEVYASFEDITQRVRLGHELVRQANTDPLTGVANRRHLMDRLATEFERTRRHPALCCSVVALDLDLFKRVNDRWGHAAGDDVLVHVTRLMQQEIRSLDLVGRSGGEEFTLLLPDTGADEALALAERLRRRVEATPLQRADETITVTVSIGVGCILASDTSPDAALVRADHALYAAKAAGRNTVCAAQDGAATG